MHAGCKLARRTLPFRRGVLPQRGQVHPRGVQDLEQQAEVPRTASADDRRDLRAGRRIRGTDAVGGREDPGKAGLVDVVAQVRECADVAGLLALQRGGNVAE